MKIREYAIAAAIVAALTVPAHADTLDDVTGAASDAYGWVNENVFRPIAGAFQDAQCYAVERAAREHNIRFWPDSGCDRAFDEAGGTAWWLE